MGWADLLSNECSIVAPWTGGRSIRANGRSFTIEGPLPAEFGWHEFCGTGGRGVHLARATRQPVLEECNGATGYLIGDRFVPDQASVNVNVGVVFRQLPKVWLVEPGLEMFTRVRVVNWEQEKLVFDHVEFPLGPEAEAVMAFEDRKGVGAIKGLTPALHLAFNFECFVRNQREEAVRLAAEEARKRAEEEAKTAQRAKLARAIGTGAGRRELAAVDFDAACRAALAITGAELLSTRPSYTHDEMIVRYRFMGYRLECVIDKANLWVISSGICLQDHVTGKSGDRLLSLEALPAVVKEAIETNQLVVYRHG